MKQSQQKPAKGNKAPALGDLHSDTSQKGQLDTHVAKAPTGRGGVEIQKPIKWRGGRK